MFLQIYVSVNKDIPSKCLRSFHFSEDIQAIPFETSLKQRKLLVASICRPPDQKIDYFLTSITVMFDHYLRHYEYSIISGDFNESEHNRKIQSFLNQQGRKNIIKKKTCFRSM